MAMIVKLMIFVIFCEFCVSVKSSADSVILKKSFPDLKKKKYLSDALDVFKRCGGWGQEIKNMTEYESVKEHCYLTMRFDVLCCIEKPDCPDGMIPEIPVVPNVLYPIETLELGCIVDEENSPVRYFCRESDGRISTSEEPSSIHETSKKKPIPIAEKKGKKKTKT